jgi:hypothetical protein
LKTYLFFIFVLLQTFIFLSAATNAGVGKKEIRSGTNEMFSNRLSPILSNSSEKKISGIWYTNRGIISEVSFEDLASQGFYFLEATTNTNTSLKNRPAVATGEALEILRKLSKTSNEMVLRLIAQQCGFTAAECEAPQAELQSNLANFLNPKTTSSNAAPIGAWDQEILIDQKTFGSIILKNADGLQSLEIKKGGLRDQLIVVRGKVEMIFSGNLLTASEIVLNTENREIVAEGNPRVSGSGMDITGDRFFFNLSNQNGFISGAHGKAQGFYFTGDIFKINSATYFSIEKGTVTVSTNEHPHFYVSLSHFDNFKQNGYFADNMGFYVHNAPFFYFPLFFQDPFGTGIQLKYGQTTREGWYAKNSLGLGIPVIGGVGINLNLYEKIGSYLALENENHFSWNDYRIKLSIAQYYENTYLPGSGGAQFSSVYIGSNGEKISRFRYKLEYTHGINLLPDPSLKDKITSRLNLTLNQSSDPTFTSEYERDLQNIQIADLLSGDKKDSFYIPQASDNRLYQFAYQFAAAGVNFGIGGSWNFLNSENKSIVDPSDNRRFETHLSSVEVPAVTFGLSGAIDPPRTISNSKRSNFLNLNYNFQSKYKQTDIYNSTNFVFSYHDNLLNADFGLSRPVSWNQDEKGKSLEVFDFSANPNVSLGYQRGWGGEEQGIDRIKANLSRTYLNAQAGLGVNFNFPSSVVKNRWASSYGFESMLPVFNLSGNYNISAKDNSLSDGSLPLTFSTLDVHALSAGFSASQTGYSLFFIPYLDVNQQFNMGFGYDLLNQKSASGATLAFTWDKSRIQNLNGNYLVGLSYFKIISASYSFPFQIYDKETTNFILRRDSGTFNFGVQVTPTNVAKGWISLNQFSFNYSATFYERLVDYRQDKMDFSLGVSLKLFKFFDAAFSLVSANPRAYVYTPVKATALGATSVGFLSDLVDSVGINGLTGLERAQFKLTSIKAEIIHDIDSWEVKLQYDLQPRALALVNNSVRGYYFDQNISFQVNLKSDFKIKGLDTQIPAWKKNIFPPALNGYIKN